jgi:hypothetical protein
MEGRPAPGERGLIGDPGPLADGYRRGPRPSRLPFGGGECPRLIAADLSPTLRRILIDAPADEPFERFGALKTFIRVHDTAIKRGLIESCGKPTSGPWLYRLTDYGRAVKAAIR